MWGLVFACQKSKHKIEPPASNGIRQPEEKHRRLLSIALQSCNRLRLFHTTQQPLPILPERIRKAFMSRRKKCANRGDQET